MFLFLSKVLPIFIYPLGLALVLLGLALSLRRWPHWQNGLILLSLVLLWVSSTRPVAMLLARSLEWQHLPPEGELFAPQGEVIVVLGGASRTHIYPRPISEVNEAGDRLLYAAWLYKQQAAPRILVSGGNIPFLGPSATPEAESMTDLLTLMGVPPEAILLEGGSRNTYENALETKKLLDREGLSEIILITSAMHMPRAQAIFAKQGMSVTPAPTDFEVTAADWAYLTTPAAEVQLFNLLPQVDHLSLVSRTLKEYVGLVVYRLRGWL